MSWKSPPFPPTREQSLIEQSAAARILIEANAGAGKTTVLCMRALSMVAQGADAARIVMMAFSEPGSEAIRRTLEKHAAPTALRRKIQIRTFDEFSAAGLLRVEGVDVKRLTNPEDVKPFVLAAIARAREASESRFPGAFLLAGSGELAVEALLEEFGRLKGTMTPQRLSHAFPATPASAAEAGFDYTNLAIFQAYEHSRLVHVGADGEQVRFRYLGDATYDLACMLLADDPPFTHDNHPLRAGVLDGIFVDEFHDMNWAMASVLRGLMAAHPDARFAGVGDVDQVIHAASGAESYFLRSGFETEFGAVERMALTETQRFGQAIAAPLARLAGKTYAWNAKRKSSIEALPLNDAPELALHIKAVLQTRQAQQPKSSNSDVAVLLRHPNSALDLEFQLLDRGIDYQATGFTAYMSRPEVLFMRMILAAAADCADAFTESSLLEAKLATWEFIGGHLPLEAAADPHTAAKVKAASFQAFRSSMLDQFFKSTSRKTGATRVRAAMDMAGSDRTGQLIPALKTLGIRDLARHVFVNAESVTDTEDSLAGLARMVERNAFGSIGELLRTIRAQEERMQGWTSKQRIVLSTIPRAKGLEFDHVIIPGLDRGGFDGDSEDERHLFYVALSRARQVVQLIHRPGNAGRLVPAHLIPGG